MGVLILDNNAMGFYTTGSGRRPRAPGSRVTWTSG